MIICFSGTGNTLFVADKLAQRTGQSIYRLEDDRLLNPAGVELSLEGSGEDVVWAFPTYSWGVPPVVVDFIKNAHFDSSIKHARHFMLTTCGDDMGRADRQWRRLMALHGLNAVAAFSVIMPNTYVCMKGFDVDSPEVVKAKLEAVDARMDDIVAAMTAGGPDLLKPGAFAWIKSRIIYPWFIRHDMSPKPFRHTEACNGCGTCSRLCPMDNITMVKSGTGASEPQWGERCAMCLRCYHACPHHAVAYGHTTDGKGRQWLGIKDLDPR